MYKGGGPWMHKKGVQWEEVAAMGGHDGGSLGRRRGGGVWCIPPYGKYTWSHEHIVAHLGVAVLGGFTGKNRRTTCDKK